MDLSSFDTFGDDHSGVLHSALDCPELDLDEPMAGFLLSDDEDDTSQGTNQHSAAKMARAESTSWKQTSQSKGNSAVSRKRPRRRKRMLTGVSKQRRAANERERKRLQIINTAFKELKHILPLSAGEENISKIEIVRLAAATIQHLSEIIEERDNCPLTDEVDDMSASESINELSNANDIGRLSPLADHQQSQDDATLMGSEQPSLVEQSLGEVDLSFLLFSSDDMRLDSVDSGLEIPSPTISETSSHDHLSFPFMEQDMLADDDVFCHGPTMIMW